MFRATRLFGAAAFAAIAVLNVQLSAAVIDQINPEANLTGWDGVSDARWNGQTFSPDLPLLTAVEFYGLPANHAWNTMPDGTAITVEIWSTAAGLPDVFLGSATRLTPIIPDVTPDPGGSPNWSGPFTFASPINVAAYIGTPSSLFFGLTTPGNGGDEEVTGFDGTNGYADGSAFVSTNDGASWNIISNRDMIFRTTGAIPEPSALGLVAVGALMVRRQRRLG